MALGNICRVKDCTNILKIQDGQVCGSHRLRFMRHGSYEISPNWNNLKKGIPLLSALGYLRINIDGKRVLHHRYIMEKHLGRKLNPEEKIHHINGIKTDNRIENLEITNQSEHMSKYHPEIWKERKMFNKSIDWNNYTIPNNNNEEICIVEGCDLKTRSRCLCVKHFTSYWKNFLRRQHIRR